MERRKDIPQKAVMGEFMNSYLKSGNKIKDGTDVRYSGRFCQNLHLKR
ncbi:hypothetical protein ABFV83_10290 [Lacrimispora sp. BS-2]|uniref:Uncharacterized protein n=1 Tax=Lacrimispora sp. BS-2 TaxID=3151850 RepID=A0AAU7PX71_9FIRM